MKKLFKNANIITHEGIILVSQDVLVNGSKIEEVDKNIETNDCEIIDCSDKFIAPGFVVMHAHSPMNIFKGIAEDVTIDNWFNQEIWPYESKMQDEDVYWGAKLACIEMMNNGVTCFADHYFNSYHIADACKECGIKADIAPTIFGFGGDCTEELKFAEKFVKDYQNDELIQPRLGPHSTYICSKDVLKKIIDKAKELNCGIHIHMSETNQQIIDSKNQYNQTPFEVLHECGGFEIPCICAHSLWVEENDLQYMNENTCVAISPKTYMKLGMGKGNLWELYTKMNVVSGNDGCASSNSLDPLEQIRLFALIGKWEEKADQFTLQEMWKLLMKGHEYLNFNSGRIEKGYSADFNIFDLNKFNTAPIYNPLAAILYSAHPAINITDTLINGNFVKRNGQLIVDVEKTVQKASKCAKEIYQRGKGQSKLYF